MFNIFGAIGRMLPGYVEGQRQAIQDNWQDLNQYSDVQAKQIQNLFAEQTFQPLVNMQYDEAARSQALAKQAGRANALAEVLIPWQLKAAEVAGPFEPWLAARLKMLQATSPGVLGGSLGSYFDYINQTLGGGYNTSLSSNPSLLTRKR